MITIIKIEFDKLSDKCKVQDLTKILPGTSGIYFIYNRKGELVYVGRTKCLRTRLTDHFAGRTHTKQFFKDFYEFRYMVVKNKTERKIYELYAINTLKPKYNQADIYDDEEFEDVIDDEKEKLAHFVLQLLKVNKGIPLGIHVIKQICENNNFVDVNLFDDFVQRYLNENGVLFHGKNFIYK